ncbi:MAG: ABC transporter permease [Oscillospiraceae bacterium]|nr:ABC transporter permease [Oscillospiraceae bacterium]
MNHLKSLVIRDIKIFYRTKGNIFFSLLAVIILIALHFAIFRNVYTDNWTHITTEELGMTVPRENLQWLADSLMFAAIIPIGAITLSLSTLALMVSDREKNVLSDFLVSPMKRNGLLSSYLLSSFLLGFTALLGFVAFFQVYFMAMYGVSFTLAQFGLISLVTIGSLIFGNVFMLLIISFLKSETTLNAIGTIVGTFSGFVSGAYVPLGMFGQVVGDFFSAMPFAQLTVLSRQAFLHTLSDVTPLTHQDISGEVARGFGIELWLGDNHIPLWGVALMATGFTLLLLICLIVRFSRMKKAD